MQHKVCAGVHRRGIAVDQCQRIAAEIMDQAGSRIVFKAFIPGFSTTTLIERIAAGLEHGI